MSTNYKNKPNQAFLKNFTRKVERRYLKINNANAFNGDLQKIINTINSTVNQIIQELNIKITDRQLPYITLTAQFNADLDEKSRFVIYSDDGDYNFEESIKLNTSQIGVNISHIIEIMIADGYRNIIISELGCDAEFVVAKEFVESAIADVLLDIVMFNSYSFLKELSEQEKHDFSYKKYSYYKNQDLECFYNYDTSKDLYYSFAFSARCDENKFDVEKYISLWEVFIKNNFQESEHIEESISKQLKYHVDYEELPKNLVYRFKHYEKGAYLIIRINKDVTEKLHPYINSVFGLQQYKKGKIKIIPIEEFEKYKELFVNLDVSAFKIVKS